jgi:hypothetical protein
MNEIKIKIKIVTPSTSNQYQFQSHPHNQLKMKNALAMKFLISCLMCTEKKTTRSGERRKRSKET